MNSQMNFVLYVFPLIYKNRHSLILPWKSRFCATSSFAAKCIDKFRMIQDPLDPSTTATCQKYGYDLNRKLKKSWVIGLTHLLVFLVLLVHYMNNIRKVLTKIFIGLREDLSYYYISIPELTEIGSYQPKYLSINLRDGYTCTKRIHFKLREHLTVCSGKCLFL